MARTLIPTIKATHAGVNLVLQQADLQNGNYFANDGMTVLVMVNLTAAPISATIVTTEYIDGDASSGLKVPDRKIVVNPGESVMAGPFSPMIFDQDDRTIQVDCSGDLGLVVSSITAV